MADCVNIGGGVLSGIFLSYTPVGHVGSAFDWEVEAIRLALSQMNCMRYKFTDAATVTGWESAIQAVVNLEP
jgi:hypothetical protein